MAQEKITVARPYAEAVFARAQEADELDLWSDMLGLLSALLQTPEISGLVEHPKLTRQQLQELMLDLGGGRLNEEGQNLVRLLVANGRVILLPEIATVFEQLKHERQGRLLVRVESAYVLNKTQERVLAEALKERLGREIEISSEKDSSLIGGIVIRAGDLVIDGSVRGQLHKLANELRI
jgi:F-type H+-transporting ATPase subunit delta